jgi:hypothetical protein
MNEQFKNVDLVYLDELKVEAERAADHFSKDGNTHSDGLRIFECAHSLKVYCYGYGNQLVDTWFCKHRSCPICQWRKSRRYCSRMHELLNQNPSLLEGKWLYLTLTVRHCPIDELRSTVNHMNQAFRRLMNRDFWKKNVAGGIRFIELSEAGLETECAHPHFHCLLLVSPSMYEGTNYVSEEQWSKEWRRALQTYYSPIVNSKRLKGTDQELRDQIISYTHYSMKPTEIAFDQRWFLVTSHEMRCLRLVEPFGVIRTMLSELDGSSLFEAMEEQETIREENDASVHTWNGTEKKYRPD